MYRQQTYRADKVAKTNKEGCKHTKKNNTTFFKKKTWQCKKIITTYLWWKRKKQKLKNLTVINISFAI